MNITTHLPKALFLVLILGLLSAGPGIARAQVMPSVELEWRGPADCAQPPRGLEHARTPRDGERAQEPAVTVSVVVEHAAGQGFSVTFAAQRGATRVQRILTAPTCDEARQAVALLVALTLDAKLEEDESVPAGVPLQPEPEPPAAAPVPAPTDEPRAPPQQLTQEPRTAVRTQQLAPELARAPSRERARFVLGLAAGIEAPVLTLVRPLATLSMGIRLGALQLDASATSWKITRKKLNAVKVATGMVGGALAASYWLTFGRWELAPSLGVELRRVSVVLGTKDVGAKPWARADSSLRAAFRLIRELAVWASADAMVALHRPRFSSKANGELRMPALGFESRVGLSWSL